MKKPLSRRLDIGMVLLLGMGGVIWLGISVGRTHPAVIPAESPLVEARALPASPEVRAAPTIAPPLPMMLEPPVSRPPSPVSVAGDVSTFITFSNRSKARVVIYWIDYEGDLQEYFELKPGGVHKQQTYVSHPWKGVNEHGEEYPVVVADGSANQEVVFRDGGAKAPPAAVVF